MLPRAAEMRRRNLRARFRCAFGHALLPARRFAIGGINARPRNPIRDSLSFHLSFGTRIYLRACALALLRYGDPRGQAERCLVSGTSLPHSSARPMMLRSFSRHRTAAFLFARERAARSLAPSLLSVLHLVGPKRRRWRLITTQSPLPVRPGLRLVPRKQQPPFAAPGAFTTTTTTAAAAAAAAQNQQSSSCAAEKRALPPLAFSAPFAPRAPRPFSPNHRRPQRSLGLLASGESIATPPWQGSYRGMGKACIKAAKAVTPPPRRHDTARNASARKEVYFRIISPYGCCNE